MLRRLVVWWILWRACQAWIVARDQPRRTLLSAMTYRVYGITVSPEVIPDPQNYTLTPLLRQKILQQCGLKKQSLNLSIVRRSLDARKAPRWVIVVDVTSAQPLSFRKSLQVTELSGNDDSSIQHPNATTAPRRPIIVGAGPAGLWAALTLARQGHHPVVLERGEPVERRGRDIGALVHRRQLDRESNFCFGEGGAGTWSDGKLTTRIGRNSEVVRQVLHDLVEHGAPEHILVDGAPHLGTDGLVRILKNLREELLSLGGEIHFGTKVTKLIRDGETVVGVDFKSSSKSGTLFGDAVVLATGHSARDIYEELYKAGVPLEPKGFAVGFRIEHAQGLINRMQYNDWASVATTGKKVTDEANLEFQRAATAQEAPALPDVRLPVASYRYALDQSLNRSVYSFCMCPGGQIVLASTEPDEVCVNGMSFSRRDSVWANSALVVTVEPDDEILDPYREEHGVLAGVAFQRDMERKAAIMGGGNHTVPVQKANDFIAGALSDLEGVTSSYRLGIRSSLCHELYPAPLTQSLRYALRRHRVPGFRDGLLHGVETRTSSPVRVARNATTGEAWPGLFPAGEGAGYAGGIVSAAVDGVHVAEKVLAAWQKLS